MVENGGVIVYGSREGGGGRKRLVNLNGYVQLVVEVAAEDGN